GAVWFFVPLRIGPAGTLSTPALAILAYGESLLQPRCSVAPGAVAGADSRRAGAGEAAIAAARIAPSAGCPSRRCDGALARAHCGSIDRTRSRHEGTVDCVARIRAFRKARALDRSPLAGSIRPARGGLGPVR